MSLSHAGPAFSIELFRYRGASKDGGTLEYVLEAGKQNPPDAVTKEKAAEIAADFMTAFYHVQIGALETQDFSDNARSLLADLLLGVKCQRDHGGKCFFVVLLPDGTVVVICKQP